MLQRNSLDAFGQGLQDLFAGRDTEDAEAAGQNLADVARLVALSLTDNKWGNL